MQHHGNQPRGLQHTYDISKAGKAHLEVHICRLVILLGIFAGSYLIFNNGATPHLPFEWEGLPFTLPLVLFAIIGFEAACSLSSRIENASENAPKAILISYTVVILLNTFFQLALSLGLGELLAAVQGYRSVFPALFGFIFSQSFAQNLTVCMNLAIISSALGGSYGIIFSNTWNWHALAHHRHLWRSDKFIELNRYHIPWMGVLIQGVICFLYLFITMGSQLPLQQTSTFGVTIAYTMSAIALLAAFKNRTDLTLKRWVAPLTLGNCLLMLSAITYSLIVDGASSLILFLSLLAVGCLMFFIQK